ncbi:hypothetical protein BDN72DRAFT_855318 [Pluteus cervinus]|uniref:Uncharacterized protein n=1 Tax=Pluteus cervinus TaxID=181527 RepID=A0ACD3B4Q5_9AGAR|nr:hypothetical protein BDN72DRAFT_855318 [Pluteus cervinus]
MPDYGNLQLFFNGRLSSQGAHCVLDSAEINTTASWYKVVVKKATKIGNTMVCVVREVEGRELGLGEDVLEELALEVADETEAEEFELPDPEPPLATSHPVATEGRGGLTCNIEEVQHDFPDWVLVEESLNLRVRYPAQAKHCQGRGGIFDTGAGSLRDVVDSVDISTSVADSES